MRTFVEIVDRGSMTAAAESLDRSQPAIVRSLAALESHLDARLLNRTTRKLSLTPEGRDYLARCRGILADVDEAELAVGTQQSEPRGDLRITAPVMLGQMFVAPAINRFIEKFRDVRVDLLLFDRNVDLVDEGIDLGVRIGPLSDSSLVATRIGEVSRVVCASPRLIDSVGEPGHPNDLAELPCIRFNGLASPGTWRFREDRRELAVSVSGNFSANHLGATRAACIDGIGFGQFLSYQVAEAIEARLLSPVLREYEPEQLPISLVYPSARLVSARLRAMIDSLKAEFSEYQVPG